MKLTDKILREAGLNELFDMDKVYRHPNKFTVQQAFGSTMYIKQFQDYNGNKIEVNIDEVEPGSFDVLFAFNGKVEMKAKNELRPLEYIRVLRTVAEIVLEFISEYQPNQIAFGGIQGKDDVYEYIARKIFSGYRVSRTNGLIVMSRIKPLKEEAISIETIFNGHDVNRYAFIWRDVTKFISVADKRAIVNKLEKLRKKSGAGLPIKKLNPQMFVATQATIDSDNLKDVARNMDEISEIPFVVKLHGVYYILDGHHRTSVALITQDGYVDTRFLDLDEGQFI